MASGDRFYQLEFKNRPVFHGDVGSLLKIDGIVVGGAGASAILLLPSSSASDFIPSVYKLNEEQWSDFLQRSDNPEVLVMPGKAFHRKLRYEISGIVQQKVWVADGFKCMYCGREMGEVQLTIDHFIPIELGGKNDQSNYLSACRRCNKDKGSQDPREFCGLDTYKYLVTYLAHRSV